MPDNKRAGIYYGSSDGHPIVWANDWQALIHKELLARETFTRAYLGGVRRPGAAAARCAAPRAAAERCHAGG